MTATMMIGEMPEVLSKIIQDYARPNKVRWGVCINRDEDKFKYFVDETKARRHFEECVAMVGFDEIVATHITKEEYKDGVWKSNIQDAVFESNCEYCGNNIIVGEYGEYGWCDYCPDHFCLECVKFKEDLWCCRNCGYDEESDEED